MVSRLTEAFGECMELQFAIANESVKCLALGARQIGQSDDAALLPHRWDVKRQGLEHGTADAQLAAALSGLVKLPLEWRLIDLPG